MNRSHAHKILKQTAAGVTLIEVVLAAFLLSVFVAGYFWAFVGSKKVSRYGDVRLRAEAVAGNALETLKQLQGNDYYGTGLEEGSKTFQMGLETDEPSLEHLSMNIGRNLEPSSKEYTVSTFEQEDSVRTRKDGFKKVTVTLEYNDASIDN